MKVQIMKIAPRTAFTLVELMVVIAVIALLASMVLVALWGAQQEARIDRTRSQITRLNQLIMSQWESYQTRPLPVRTVPLLSDTASPQRSRARQRLDIMRELMRMEMPDRVADIEDEPYYGNAKLGFKRTTLSRAYLRRANALFGPLSFRPMVNPLDPNEERSYDLSSWNKAHQGAECLYLIVSMLNDDETEALSFFRDDEIGDVDGDGMREFIDAWGNPLVFLRWPLGLQIRPWWGATSADAHTFLPSTPDSFDLSRADPLWNDGSDTNDPFTLTPVIISAGPDGLYGFGTEIDVPVGGPNVLQYRATLRVPHDPYVLNPPVPTPPPFPNPNAPPNNPAVGQPVNSDFDDNIHSHLLEVR